MGEAPHGGIHGALRQLSPARPTDKTILYLYLIQCNDGIGAMAELDMEESVEHRANCLQSFSLPWV